MIKIAPSLLSADFMNLKEQLNLIQQAQAEWLHFDVMDGHFVPNLTFGPKILEDIKKNSSLFLDVHIMVDQPSVVAPWFKEADMIVFHAEAVNSVEEMKQVIRQIKEQGNQVGISIKPNTQPQEIVEVLKEVDLVLVMSVEPGFGGQKFIESALDKITWLKDYRKQHQLSYLIEVDGGINAQTGKSAVEAGADVLVAGSFVFKGDILTNIKQLKESE